MPNAGTGDTTNGVGGGCTASNTSYWMPGYYRVFQQVTGDAYWGKAADDVVALFNLAANSSTGIIVNEVDQNGVGVSGQTYDYNSCRIPWRAVLDYLWNGTAGAAQATTKITNWANTVGIMKIVDGYNANGTATGQYTGLNEWVGGFAAGAMSNSQSLVDSFTSYFVSIANDNGTYYGASPPDALSPRDERQRVEPAGDDERGRTAAGPQLPRTTEAARRPPARPAEPQAGDDGGGSISSSSSGGSGETSADGGAAGGGNAATPGAPDSSKSGCGCRLGPSPSGGVAGVALASLFALCVAPPAPPPGLVTPSARRRESGSAVPR